MVRVSTPRTGADMQQRQSGVGVSLPMKRVLEIMKLDTLIV